MDTWANGMCDPIRGNWELRWVAENVQHRSFGYFGSAPHLFVMLHGCTHKGKVYEPQGCLETVDTRKKQIAQGKASTVAYELIR